MSVNPKVTFVIPTLNAARVLEACLSSISEQNYPKEKIEILIVDGGSTDGTMELANKFGAKVLENKLKTGESGKAVGVKSATGEFVALVDSDNILPTKEWLNEMIQPLLENPDAVGSEPWEYTWRKEDGFITRYCALIGMNDPFVHFLGNYDRMNLLTGKWTEVERKELDRGSYLEVSFYSDPLPTIGANGSVFRADFLKSENVGDYLFDIDILSSYLKKNGAVKFIKTKNGIIHTFCESDVRKFVKKQKRRVKDYIYHKSIGNRKYDWSVLDIFGSHPTKTLKFIVYCLTVVPLFAQALIGYRKKPDFAWFFHPLACEITFFEYSFGRVIGLFKKSELSRKGWGQ